MKIKPFKLERYYTLHEHTAKYSLCNSDCEAMTIADLLSLENGAKEAVYSYGHRNPQGMTLHPETRKIWSHEHGPKGGDEINIVESGKNYGC